MTDQSNFLNGLHQVLLHLPIVTTFCAAFFCIQLFSRLRAKGGGLHLLWWGIGMATYGIGTFTEAYTTLFGWDPTVFRAWYVAGAFLGGYPLAQGSIYLLMNRKFAHRSALIVTGFIAVASVFVFLSPLNASLAEAHRLSGKVLEWRWVRLISPFINTYSLIFLVGGAAVSAMRFRRAPQLRNRYVGNILIAVGALLPGIGGSMTRAGYVEVLYVTELVGLLLIYAGYRKCVADRAPAASKTRAESQAGVSAGGASGAEGLPRAVVVALVALLAAAPMALQAAEAEPGNDPAAAESEMDEAGERGKDEAPADPEHSFFATTTVTATGSARDSFEVPTPVTVITEEQIEREMPYNPADLLRGEPGVDVNGVGPNQGRPIIRGQRGLRVLFLQNGLRMNNPRRQTDFGEIPGLVDTSNVQAVEVVRGPASVLYGSDAIGGVLNLITKSPGGQGFRGALELTGSSADDQRRAHAGVEGRSDRFAYRLAGAYRETDDYDAPSGSFGDITLDESTRVVDTGITDDSLDGTVTFEAAEGHELQLRASRYRADQTGFGFVDPADLGNPDDILVRILYPYQDYDRLSLEYVGAMLGSSLADTVEVQAYYQSNERELANQISNIDIGPIFPGAPSSTIDIDTLNFTDLDTLGLRAEAVKVVGGRHIFTYGVEAYEDDSFNTDVSTTEVTLRFPFPPFEVVDSETDTMANTPNATNASYGAFAQGEMEVGDRLKLTAGARYQQVDTSAEPTPGWDIEGLDFDDDEVVGAVNVLFRVREDLNLVATYGTAFRAPNIVERLFNGPTPEGSGFQILNPDLVSETSENWDLGLKYRRRNAHMEAIYFRNDIDDGIIQDFLSQEEIDALPQDIQDQIDAVGAAFVVQQRNIQRLRYEGVELALGYRSERGISVGLNYTHLDAKRIDSTQPPTGDTFQDKVNAHLRYQPPLGRYWVEYRVRHNGSTDANVDPDEPLPPVGDTFPSFTIHTLAGGYSLDWGGLTHELGLIIDNLTDELYAEFSNATFFRPQAERNYIATYRLRF